MMFKFKGENNVTNFYLSKQKFVNDSILVGSLIICNGFLMCQRVEPLFRLLFNFICEFELLLCL